MWKYIFSFIFNKVFNDVVLGMYCVMRVELFVIIEGLVKGLLLVLGKR